MLIRSPIGAGEQRHRYYLVEVIFEAVRGLLKWASAPKKP
jgi:hypothetical protein